MQAKNNTTAPKLKDCQSIIPLVKNFAAEPKQALFVLCDYKLEQTSMFQGAAFWGQWPC